MLFRFIFQFVDLSLQFLILVQKLRDTRCDLKKSGATQNSRCSPKSVCRCFESRSVLLLVWFCVTMFAVATRYFSGYFRFIPSQCYFRTLHRWRTPRFIWRWRLVNTTIRGKITRLQQPFTCFRCTVGSTSFENFAIAHLAYNNRFSYDRMRVKVWLQTRNNQTVPEQKIHRYIIWLGLTHLLQLFHVHCTREFPRAEIHVRLKRDPQ